MTRRSISEIDRPRQVSHSPTPPRLRFALIFILSALGASIGGVCAAGDLNPPPGPIAPTHKTLTEVEPRTAINATNTPGDADSLFKITQPGSYYLASNVTGVVGKQGIEIASSGVTVDLNGFDLVGVAGSLGGVAITEKGIAAASVVNGTVRDWGADGVDLRVALATRVERVIATGNSGSGISGGFASAIANCLAANNTIDGVAAGQGSTVVNCSVYLNGDDGIIVSTGSTVTGCSTYDNSGNGIAAGVACTVSGCTSYSNTIDGINTAAGSTVSGCTVRSNTRDGIECGTACTIRENTCILNGASTGDGANIHSTGGDSRIEGNSCASADRGIDVDGAGNIIIRNTCSGNTTNWDVVANNIILVVNGAAAGAVNGNTGGVAPGSTDPNANFTY